MGGLVRGLFGGGKNTSTSSSGNKAWDFLSGELSPAITSGVNNLSQLSEILGRGFGDYKKNAGFDFQLNKGTRDISGSAAARGLLNSGSTAKALAKYETDLGSTMYNNWLDRLGGTAQTGLNAAGALTGAGGYSQGMGKGTSQNGILSSLFG